MYHRGIPLNHVVEEFTSTRDLCCDVILIGIRALCEQCCIRFGVLDQI
jgi:hypothetical protein